MRDSTRPTKHTQIIDYIRNGILDGKYKPGQRVPSEKMLSTRFHATRSTVGKALGELEHGGLIVRRRGSGSFVKTPEERKMYTFGLLIPGLGEGEIFEPICNSIATVIAERNHRLIWGQFPAEKMDERCAQAERLCRCYIEQRVDGVFLAPVELAEKMHESNTRIAEMLSQAGIPVVLLDTDVVRYPARSQFDLIGIDNRRVGYVLANHFLAQHCERIVFVCLPHKDASGDKRRYARVPIHWPSPSLCIVSPFPITQRDQ